MAVQNNINIKQEELERYIAEKVKEEIRLKERELNEREIDLLNREREIEKRKVELNFQIRHELGKKEAEFTNREKDIKILTAQIEKKLKDSLALKEKEFEKKESFLQRKIDEDAKKREKDAIRQKLNEDYKLSGKLNSEQEKILKEREELDKKWEDFNKKKSELNKQKIDLDRREVLVNEKDKLVKGKSTGNVLNRVAVQQEIEVSNDWLITYSDMITLLLTMFVLMFSLARIDQNKFEKIKKAIDVNLLKKSGSILLDEGGLYETEFEVLKRELSEIFEQNNLGSSTQINLTENGIKLELASSVLYDVGSAEIKSETISALQNIANLIKSIKYKDYGVVVVGHTDNTPINTFQYPTNWELSVARAAKIVRFFIDNGILPAKLSASGVADSQPKLPNIDDNGIPLPQNQAANRRIEIFIEKSKK